MIDPRKGNQGATPDAQDGKDGQDQSSQDREE